MLELRRVPCFPAELEREIFETTAQRHPGEILTLLRVARRVLVSIEPLLYRVARESELRWASLNAFLKAVDSKPADFFHKCVRHLCLEFMTRTDDAVRILEVCTGVVDLALGDQATSPDLLPFLAKMPLRRLSADLSSLFGEAINLAHPMFRSLTHLDMMDLGDCEWEPEILPHIPALPALTHLALNWDVSRDALEDCLEQSPRLKLMLLVWICSEEHLYKTMQIPHSYDVDVRLVMGCCNKEYWANWEASARGLPCLWSLGDEFVARKHRGEIEAGCY
ncbi:hypothetical protein DFH06DRAFT_62134 [Mycena polygramma]|nr:hypothetical protein DFH06DRAFT_62134 [Mycena polygramma]